MSHGKSAFLRIIVALVGLIFVALGVWGVGLFFHNEYAERVGNYYNGSFWQNLPEQNWYPTAVGIAAAVLILVGLWLWYLIIDHRKFSDLEVNESAEAGRITIQVDDIASAVAQQLERLPGVLSSSHKTERDRKQKVMTVEVDCDANADLGYVARECRQAASDIVDAIPGDDVHARFFIHAAR